VAYKFCDFLKLNDFSIEELLNIIWAGYELKSNISKVQRPFTGKTLAMIFEKPSTRTRISFEVGMLELGGHAIYLNAKDLQIGRGETIEDTARILSDYVNLVMIRTFKQEDIELLAKFSSVPIINGLTDMYHPCQVLSDIFSIMEGKREFFDFNHFKKDDIIKSFNNINFLYIGDSTSNMANSLMDASSIFGLNSYFLSPNGYELDKNLYKLAKERALASGGDIRRIESLDEIDKRIDVFYTDIWISMGKEKEQKERYKAFQGYQLNQNLLNRYSNNDCLVMHCLPAHRGEEITNEVIEGKNSIVFVQAKNRLYIQKAIMLYVMNELR